MGFQTGLSGLNAASKSLDVISNNVANSGNVGFKFANTQFSDVFAAALNGATAGVQVGIGTAVGGVNQIFSQGNISPTNNPLDVAINGSGFFRVEQGDGSIAYTRNGQFEVDKDGFIVGGNGYKLTGYSANAAGVILPAQPSPLQVETADLQPNVTTEARLGMNLDSRATVFDTAAGDPAFDELDPTTYSSSTSVSVYDSLGNAHVMTLYFRKIPASATGVGDWEMFTQIDGGTVPTTPVSVQFDSSGALTSASPTTVTIDFDNVAFGGATDFDVDLYLDSTTQYGSAFGVNSQTQDGYASGRLSGVTIDRDGTIQGRYSNGQSRNLGQIVLANFQAPNGLLSLGGNLWTEGPASGQPLIGAPGSGSLGVLSAGAVEESNVDLTAELVNMITQQRAYQANAQSIRTQDQILQTLVNLR
ncbi:MAG: flagellar hook protein FlgE [Rhodocyclaceae bacterium]|nr:flagellar hook protein FlgE [Rhodocyclaceae bacterium]